MKLYPHKNNLSIPQLKILLTNYQVIDLSQAAIVSIIPVQKTSPFHLYPA